MGLDRKWHQSFALCIHTVSTLEKSFPNAHYHVLKAVQILVSALKLISLANRSDPHIPNIPCQGGECVRQLVYELSPHNSTNCSDLADTIIQNPIKPIQHGKHNLCSCCWLKSALVMERTGPRGAVDRPSVHKLDIVHLSDFTRAHSPPTACKRGYCKFILMLFQIIFYTRRERREQRRQCVSPDINSSAQLRWLHINRKDTPITLTVD